MYPLHQHSKDQQEDDLLMNSFAQSFAPPPVSIPPQAYTLENLQNQTSMSHQPKALENRPKSHPFECRYCFRGFNQKQTLKQHILTHTGQRPFKCDVCFKTFTQQGSLQRHISIHTGEKPFECTYCNLSFRQKINLTRHMKLHSGVPKEFQCNVCKRTFDRKRTLLSHELTHTERKKVKCDCCNKMFVSKQNLLKHQKAQEYRQKGMERPEVKKCELRKREFVIINCKHCGKMFRRSKSRLSITSQIMATCCLSCSAYAGEPNPTGIHVDVEILECGLCRTFFYRKDAFEKHKIYHNADRPYECDICHYRFKLKRLLTFHKVTHHNTREHQCHICGLDFKFSSNLMGHYYVVHGEELGKDLEQYVNVFECAHCTRILFHRSRMIRHLKLHEEKGAALPEEKRVRRFKTESFYGDGSAEASQSKDSMILYKGSVRIKKEIKSDLIDLFEPYVQISLTGQDDSDDGFNGDDVDDPLCDPAASSEPPKEPSETHPYFCYICKRTYKKKRSLEQHFQIIHMEHDFYKCDYCDKTFRAKNSLFKHSFIHRLTKFECADCGKTFNRKDALVSHQKTHMGRSYICTHCPKTFFHRRSLQLHLMSHKTEKDYECGVCEKKFHYKSSLLRHHLSHSGERKYSCPICHLSFIQKNHLDKHFLRHDEIEKKVTFKCADCDKCFYRKDNYLRHRQGHEENRVLYPCPMCGKKFKDKYNMGKHAERKNCKPVSGKTEKKARARKA